MSQHDLDIANQGFPATRADINNALQALGSSNSGATAPSTTYANQIWYDTANNIIKIRNEDNDAWISLFTLDQSADNIEALTVNGTVTVDSLDMNGGELILDADADTSITADTDDNIDFKTGGTDRLTITDGGTIKLLGATDNLIRADSNSSRVRIFGGSSASVTNGAALTLLGVSHSDGNYADLAAGSGGTIRFRRGTTENARFDGAGNFAVGQTTPSISSVGANIRPIGLVQAVRDDAAAIEIRRNNSNGSIQTFRRDGTVVGGINVTTSSTSYATSSDYRLKENVADLTGAIARVKQLAPKRFNFIVDPDDTTVDGFIAHEAQTVVPEAITGTHNETRAVTNAVLSSNGELLAENVAQDDWTANKGDDNDDLYPSDSTWSASHNEPVYQGIDQSKLVPLLTGALQEAIAKIESLETRVAALEA